ncbi:Spectinomycin tetracycline efflux pump [Nocardia otitidiscaviarum]|uniref:Spectinomycin tetracycline efflux pump n=1 Tax=Nocardia otitidiscaviarum TaxID=1823 RepID=A0A378YVY4_9NOCA|nr:MFS transporter [Nocardia otitidiscaviarum]SUA81302.1 Spectinomycin tetracycline efflux pump [Nocardia otitidiscaviarum]
MAQPDVQADRVAEKSSGAAKVVLAVACAAQFMVVLDISVVNVALPSIRDALGFDETGLQWVVNAYALTFAGFLLLGGRLADLFGRRRIFLTGLVLFAGASLAGGLAGSAAPLVAARAVQGLGAAVLAPATLTILTATFPEGPARTRALATWTAVGIAGGTAGNLVGGVLTEFLSWRSTLLINVPIGVVAVALTARHVAADRPGGARPRLDVVGAVLATAGLGTLAFGVAAAAESGWASSASIAGIGAGVALLVVFLAVEARVAVAPLIPLRLFTIRSVAVGNVAMLLAGASLNPMWFFLTLSMQNVLGYSPLLTGLAFLPHTVVAILVGARATPWLMRRVDGRVLITVGSLLAAAGFWWQAQLSVDSGYVLGILGPAIVFSIGSGLLNTPITTAVTAGVPTADAGAASGVMNTAKQVGGALGLAALITVAGAHGGGPGVLLDAYNRAFYAIAAIMIVVALVAAALPAQRDRESP